TTEEVQERLGCPTPALRRSCRQGSMATSPGWLVDTEFIKGEIFDLKEAALFKVWRGDSPTAAKIMIEPITEYIPKGPLRFCARVEPHRRIARVVLQRDLQHVKDLLGQVLMG